MEQRRQKPPVPSGTGLLFEAVSLGDNDNAVVTDGKARAILFGIVTDGLAIRHNDILVDNAVADMAVIPDSYIIEEDRFLDKRLITDNHLGKKDGGLHASTGNDYTTGNYNIFINIRSRRRNKEDFFIFNTLLLCHFITF